MMVLQASVQNTLDSSVTLDPSDLQDRDSHARPAIAWPASITLPKRPDFSRWLEYAVLSALFVAWLVVAWGRISLFLSEPTATKIYWEKTFQRPAISICPQSPMNNNVMSAIYDDSEEEKVAIFGNLSLKELIRTSGLQLVDMIESLNETDEYKANARTQVFTIYYGYWKTSLNYVLGGACATLTPGPYTMDIQHLLLRRQPEFEGGWKGSAVYSYNVIIHGNSEYWGSPVSGMETYIVTNETTREELFVTIDREVKPNLRRAPCEPDPAYNILTCQRHCYFDCINCRMEEDADDDGRPLCMASQAPEYVAATGDTQFRKFLYDREHGRWPIRECPCPAPCTSDQFGFHLRPSVWSSDAEYLQLQLRLGDVRRVMETFVTYTVWDLLADMGGYLGLLLGSSLLSVFSAVRELAVRVCKRCAALVRRRCR